MGFLIKEKYKNREPGSIFREKFEKAQSMLDDMTPELREDAVKYMKKSNGLFTKLDKGLGWYLEKTNSGIGHWGLVPAKAADKIFLEYPMRAGKRVLSAPKKAKDYVTKKISKENPIEEERKLSRSIYSEIEKILEEKGLEKKYAPYDVIKSWKKEPGMFEEMKNKHLIKLGNEVYSRYSGDEADEKIIELGKEGMELDYKSFKKAYRPAFRETTKEGLKTVKTAYKAGKNIGSGVYKTPFKDF